MRIRVKDSLDPVARKEGAPLLGPVTRLSHCAKAQTFRLPPIIRLFRDLVRPAGTASQTKLCCFQVLKTDKAYSMIFRTRADSVPKAR